MRRLLQVNVTANRGSTGKIAEEIGQMVQEKGWDSVIAYGKTCRRSQSELFHIGSRINFYEHVFETRLFDNHGLASRLATRNFVKKIKAIRPDIIHLHNIHDYYLNYPILFEYLNSVDIPVVWTLHDCWAFTGHCAHFVTVGCEKWKTGCYSCPLKGDYPKSFIDQSKRNYGLKKECFAGNKNLHIVAVSEWQVGYLQDSFLKDKDMRVIHNGIDINVFKPKNNLIQPNKSLLLGVSSVWNRDKGLYDFYKIRERLDGDQYDIVLVGLNKKQIESLPQGIVGIERTESVQKLAELYSSATVFVNPTYADTFPTVNLEAMACGTPVITYRTGGSPEAVSSETGVVVEQGDIEALTKAIVDICLSERRQYLESCRNRAVLLFDKNNRYKEYYTLYEDILKNH